MGPLGNCLSIYEQGETSRMMYCRKFGEENRKSRIEAQLEPEVGAQKQEVAAQEVHQEEACEDQNVQLIILIFVI
jgi:hypothetical protein